MAAQRKQKDKTISFENHELIPYACHLNNQTIITKNSELVQYLAITNSGGLSDDAFRTNLRNVINENIDPSKIAVWIHTTRTLKQIKESGSENFVKHIDILWKQALPDELRYANTIYLSLVIDFKKFPLWQPANYLRSLSAKADEKKFNRVLEERNAELQEISDNIIKALKKFGARRLEVVKRDGVYYSEQMEFLHKLLTFIDEPVQMPLGDIALNLYQEKFDFNLYTGMITMTNQFGNYYGMVISVKETTQLPAAALKDILNGNYEFVISEAIDFSFGNKYLPAYQKQKYINSLTEDKQFVEIMGGEDYEPVPEDFGLSQINILIMHKTRKELGNAVKHLRRKFAELGVYCYAEDLRLERSFWSMLGGNFPFLKRQELIAHSDIGNYACFGTDKFTAIEGCMFSEPVTFFETADGEAFSLHFLNDGQSNILIAGGMPEERQVVANLIAAQAAKLGVDVIFFDETGKYENFARSIGAGYMNVFDLESIKERVSEKTVIVFNSLKMVLNDENFEFLFNFLDYAASKNAMIIACAEFSDNCEPLLPSFRSQIYLHGNVEKFADHFDFFEDEIRMVELLEPDSFYLKQEYNELVLKFHPTEKLVRALLEGYVK